jgi:predicted RNA-binding protein with PUA-like domain
LLIKFQRFTLHAIEFVARLDALQHARARRGCIEMKHKRDIGFAIAYREFVQLFDHARIKTTRDALINCGRIKKTIGNDDFALGERGPDHFTDELTAARFEKEQFGFGHHAGAFGRKLQQIADRFANGRAAGLARNEQRNAEVLETLGKPFHLRGFSAALRSFECDKDSARHPASLKHAERIVECAHTVYLHAMKRFWLVKQEPSAYSWTNFLADGKTSWTGVRNYTARNNLRAMQKGDEVLFYHSVTDKAVVGIAEVSRTAYVDPTATEGDWSAVDLKPKKALARPVTLDAVKQNPRLKKIALLRLSRLSVQLLTETEFREILRMGH